MDLSATIHMLGDALGQVITDLEAAELFETEERIRALAKDRRAGDEAAAERLQSEVAALDLRMAGGVALAFTVYFELVNLAEESYRVSTLRQREDDEHPEPIDGSIGEAIARLKARGVSAEQMSGLLRNLHIEPVLTAHPTEAKRRSILSKLRRIYDLIQILNSPTMLAREREEALATLRTEVATIWLTEQSRTVRPSVTDEVRTGLFFVDEVLWEVLPRIYAELDMALARYYPGLSIEHPWLTLGSWIGGDRDGNPNVTTEVTAETLRLHRGLAVEHYRHSFQVLSRRLSLSGKRIPLKPELAAWLVGRHPLSPHVAYLEDRYPDEPYRLILAQLAAAMADASQDDATARLLSNAPSERRVMRKDLSRPLDMVALAVPHLVAEGSLDTLRRQLQIFGLHVARLDIRQHSERLTSALAEVLRALKIHPALEQADTSHRQALLLELLRQEPPPDLADHLGVTAETVATWSVFKLISRARSIYGRELVGPFIISMTHDAADVLGVLLMARWTDCDTGLQIVPLVETLPDLESAGRMLDELFRLDVYRQHVATCADEQMVMVGYSDSNKDGGYLAANWALYQAQENIAQACRDHEIKLTLFHGRGGTLARGGGPARRAIYAQPSGTVAGRFRVTEQGEVIAERYSNGDLAHRHLEQVVNAVLLASSPIRAEDQDGGVLAAWREEMQGMSEAAWHAYRDLVYETPGFLDFWQTATPIDEIARMHIGSRPTARREGTLEFEAVRAIPWVFSWMQSRFNLPGWYGLGSGLEAGPPLARLQEMYAGWPFFRALLDNVELSLLKADLNIAKLYAGLVPDRPLSERIMGLIQTEYQRTRATVLAITGHQELLNSDPIIQRSVFLRNPYVDPLNYIQVETLRRLRAVSDPESTEAIELRQVIVITINGIAAGLRNTG